MKATPVKKGGRQSGEISLASVSQAILKIPILGSPPSAILSALCEESPVKNSTT